MAEYLAVALLLSLSTACAAPSPRTVSAPAHELADPETAALARLLTAPVSGPLSLPDEPAWLRVDYATTAGRTVWRYTRQEWAWAAAWTFPLVDDCIGALVAAHPEWMALLRVDVLRRAGSKVSAEGSVLLLGDYAGALSAERGEACIVRGFAVVAGKGGMGRAVRDRWLGAAP